MTVDIDTRLREAGRSLRQASQGLTAPAGTPDRPRAHRRGALVAVAAVVVAAMALVAALVRDGGGTDGVSTDPTSPTTTAEPTEPADPRWTPTVVPEGLARQDAVDLPMPVAVPASHMTLYGDPDADDPLVGPAFVIRAQPSALGAGLPGTQSAVMIFGSSDPSGQGDDTESTIVRGHPGYASGSPGTGIALVWRERPDLWLEVGGRGLDRDQLVAVAEALTVDDRTVTLDAVPPGLPGGVEELGSADVASVNSALVLTGREGHLLRYRAPDAGRALTVATYAGDAVDLALLRWAAGAARTADEVTIAGEPGWSSTTALPEGLGRAQRLLWQPAPGVVAAVTTTDLTEAEALATAESLSPG